MVECTSKSHAFSRNCFLLHGFNVKDGGKNTTDKLGELVKKYGWNPVEFDYGWLGMIGARSFSRNIATILRSIAHPGDIAIGHSNGCNIINQALDQGAELERVAYISPALEKNMPLADHVDKCVVLHTKRDWVVQLSAFLPFHPWGSMGRHGYTGRDRRYQNIDCTNWSSGHSSYFSPTNIARTRFMLERYLCENQQAEFDLSSPT